MKEGIDILDHSNNQNIIANTIPTSSYGILIDTGIIGTLRHGNTINGLTQWDSTATDHTFPSSYYLKSKPSFFTSEAWPPFGPDVSGTSIIPAENRFKQEKYILKTKYFQTSLINKPRSGNMQYNTLGRQLANHPRNSISLQPIGCGVFITVPENDITVKLK
jgi:hypothetical protein